MIGITIIVNVCIDDLVVLGVYTLISIYMWDSQPGTIRSSNNPYMSNMPYTHFTSIKPVRRCMPVRWRQAEADNQSEASSPTG